MDTRPDAAFDTAVREALRAGHPSAPWPHEADVATAPLAVQADPGAAAARATSDADNDADSHAAGWANVLRRAQQAQPLGHGGRSEPLSVAANDAPMRQARGHSAWRLRAGVACVAMALAGLVWWQGPLPAPASDGDGDGLAPAADTLPRGASRGASSAGSQAMVWPLVQVNEPAAEARRWVAELERLGAVVRPVPGAAGDIVLDIAVADDTRRMAVNAWLATFDQQLDGQGRLSLRMASRR